MPVWQALSACWPCLLPTDGFSKPSVQVTRQQVHHALLDLLGSLVGGHIGEQCDPFALLHQNLKGFDVVIRDIVIHLKGKMPVNDDI